MPRIKLKNSPTTHSALSTPTQNYRTPIAELYYEHSILSPIMGPPRRKVLATAQETLTPPDELSETHVIARAIKATGNNIYLIELPDKTQMLVELPARFRSTIWIKRGSYVVIDTKAQEERDNKIGGEIINIVRDEKAWRKAPFWYDFFWH